MIFRIANTSDTQKIAQLHARSWQQNYSGSFSKDFLENKVHADRLSVWEERLKSTSTNQYILLAEENMELVGFCCAYFNENKEYGTYLDNLHVSKKGSGKGLGTKLIHFLITEMAVRSNHRFYLWVLENNHSAIRFYENLNGERAETLQANDIGDASFSKIRYVWKNIEDLKLLIAIKLKAYECGGV